MTNLSGSISRERILVVDDSAATREVLQRNLSSKGYHIFTASDVEEAFHILGKEKFDLVITDLKMPKISGLELIKYVRENLANSGIMMITGYPSINGAVDAMKSGAEEYLVKPFTDEELFSTVERVLDKLHKRHLVNSAVVLAKKHGIIGQSKPMQEIFRLIDKATSTDAIVLISGESGTGKELVARAIHYGSSKCSAPFVPVNCGAIPDNLLESELFGHIKGAFTGACETRAGFFQTAEGGTIFLDEISDTTLPMQTKLLRVLQNKEICMVGSSRARRVETRILAASNKDLSLLVKKGLFREDLFYRLNVVNIVLPPLRERESDILLLLRYFSEKSAKAEGKQPLRFTDETLQVLIRYSWPGNIRELENFIQRLVIMLDRETVKPTDLLPSMRYSLPQSGVYKTLAEAEVEHIQNVLDSVDGNKTRAAEILGIDRKTLREKLSHTRDSSSSNPI